MIEFEHAKDRLRFKKRNNSEAKKMEVEMEKQRVEKGLIPAMRWKIIDKAYRFKPNNGN